MVVLLVRSDAPISVQRTALQSRHILPLPFPEPVLDFSPTPGKTRPPVLVISSPARRQPCGTTTDSRGQDLQGASVRAVKQLGIAPVRVRRLHRLAVLRLVWSHSLNYS